MDLVSVIIPYYKKKKYILNSIKSVLNQTYKYWRIYLTKMNKLDLENTFDTHISSNSRLENKKLYDKEIINS